MQKSWSLYNQKEKLRIDDLRLDQVQTILLAVPSTQMKNWYACQEGDLRWQNLPDIHEFYEQTRQPKGAAAEHENVGEIEERDDAKEAAPQPKIRPNEEPRRPLFEDASEELAKGSTLTMEALQTKERRTARRYVRNLKFRVRLPDTTLFECQTHDVSMTGLGLEEVLPKELLKTFKAELSLNKTNLKILCTRVGDQQLKIVEAESWDVLRSWIINW